MIADVAAITEDDFLGGAIKLRQPAAGYRAGTDMVLLASAIAAAPGEEILDIGAGVGGVALCLARRLPGVRLAALELTREMAALAHENVILNRLEDRVAILEGDLAHPPKGLKRGFYDQVVSNPPYLERGKVTPPPLSSKATAHVSAGLTLEQWVAASIRFVKMKGRVTFIYRADRLNDLLAALTGKAGEITVFPIWPRRGRPARRVIVTARRGLKGPLVLESGLVLHEADGAFTPRAEAIMRNGAGLAILGAETINSNR
jgi:tRNA1(Val) A37 N6-methylase TrmN6